MVGSDGILFQSTVNGCTYTFTASGIEEGLRITITINFTLSSSTSGAGTFNWSVTDGTYYCNGGTTVTATKAQSGMPLWEFKTGHGVNYSPAIGVDSSIYVGSNNSKLYAITRTPVVWQLVPGPCLVIM